MRIIQSLDTLVAERAVLNGTVHLQPAASTQVQAGEIEALFPAAFLVASPGEEQRESWVPWLPVEVLAEIPWGSRPNPAMVDEWFRPHSAVASDFDGSFGEDDIPENDAIPERMTADERLRWWSLAVRIQAWEFSGR